LSRYVVRGVIFARAFGVGKVEVPQKSSACRPAGLAAELVVEFHFYLAQPWGNAEAVVAIETNRASWFEFSKRLEGEAYGPSESQKQARKL
jgi:hypothetical protein